LFQKYQTKLARNLQNNVQRIQSIIDHAPKITKLEIHEKKEETRESRGEGRLGEMR
jgi:F0F1-type ATP synthase membrane subunit b/b'